MVAHATEGADPATAEPSTAELIQRATEQMSRLVREELALARAELARKGRSAGIGAGLVGGAGIFIVYGTGALVVAAILGLAQVLDGWLAALVVGGAMCLVAGLLAVVGVVQLRRGVPPVPSAAVRSVRADIDALASAVRDSRGRRS